MRAELILPYAHERAKERGYKNGYQLKYRDIKVEHEYRIDATGELWFLVETDNSIKIKSYTGIFDKQSDQVREDIHEHEGIIIITNRSLVTQSVHFIQLAPNQL